MVAFTGAKIYKINEIEKKERKGFEGVLRREVRRDLTNKKMTWSKAKQSQ